MQVLIEKIVNDRGLIAPVTAFVRQRVIIAVEEEGKRESPAMKKRPSALNCSPSASAAITLDKESKVRRSSSERHDRKDRRHHDSSLKLRDKHRKHRSSPSFSSRADAGLKVTSSKSSCSSSRSRSRISDSDRHKCRARLHEENFKVIHLVNNYFRKQLTIKRTRWRTRRQNTIDRFQYRLPR